MFWKRKRPPVSPPVTQVQKAEADSLKDITEHLYKKVHELAVKNKILQLLRRLYQISLQSIQPQELAEKVTTTVQRALDFELVGIYVPDKEMKYMTSAGVALSDRLKHIEQESHISLAQTFDLSIDTEFTQAVRAKKIYHSEGIGDVWNPYIDQSIRQTLATESHIKTIIGYPLIVEKKLVGVLMLCLNRAQESLTAYETESISGLAELISIALDKSILYEELKVANEKLAIANEGQKNLLHFITHQIKGYFTKGRNVFAELLSEKDYQPISEPATKMIDAGFKALTEGVGMVQQMLNAANMERGTIQYIFAELDFKELVKEVAQRQKEYAEQKGLTLKTAYKRGNYTTQGDALQLKEVIKNLIDNSIKYTASGTITVGLEVNEGKLLFSVKDTGRGISAEDIPKLFVKGGRAKDSTKVNVDSTGYGLFIVKNIVEVGHKGRVWVESEGEGKGSQFYVEIPAMGVATTPISPATAQS